MAVKIKLKRMGKIHAPYYRVVVADARAKRDGRAIEEIGKYHPKLEPSLIEIDSERAQYWLSVGAQPTDPVRNLLKITGDWQRFHGEDGAEGTLKTGVARAGQEGSLRRGAEGNARRARGRFHHPEGAWPEDRTEVRQAGSAVCEGGQDGRDRHGRRGCAGR